MSLRETLYSLWNPTAELLTQAATDLKPSPKADAFLKHLQVLIQRRLGSPHPGEFRGIFKGHGMDLKSLREYQPGDDIRKIDWNVLARTGVPHTKEYYDERQVPIWFFVDTTASMHFGQSQKKLVYAKYLVGLLGLLALKAGHRVGMVLWRGEQKPEFIRPKPSQTQLEWMITKLDESLPLDSFGVEPGHFPDLPSLLTNRCLVFLLSDFGFLDTAPQSLKTLSRLAAKHQVYSLLLMDTVEEELSYGHGWLPLSDGTVKGMVWLNTSDRWLIREYRQAFQQRLEQRKQQLSPWSRFYTVNTQQDPVDVVLQLAGVART